MVRKISLLFFALVFVFSAVGFPSMPMNVYGYVTEDGQSVVDKRVEFRYNGTLVHNASTDSDGFYDAYVPYDSSYSGKQLGIYVNDVNAANFTYEQGTSVRKNLSGDFRAPEITDIEVVRIANESAVIQWETDENSTSEIIYGRESSSLDQSAERNMDNLTKDHSINISDLFKGTEYHFKVASEDVSGNRRVDDNSGDLYDFTTTGATEETNNDTQKKEKKKEEKQQSPGNLPDQDQSKEVSAILQNGEASVTVDNVSDSVKLNIVQTSSSQSLESVNINVGGTLEQMEIDVEELDTKPEAVPDAGEVYRYQSISTSASEEQVTGATITFRVSKDWLNQRDATLSQVVMKRYQDSWKTLETTYLSSEENYYRFEAETPGFSFFAVALQDQNSSEGVKISNVTVEPVSGKVPFNVTVNGTLVNNKSSEASKEVIVYFDGSEELKKTFELGPGETKNFSMEVRIEQPGSHVIEVGDGRFTIEATGDPSILPVIAGILLVLVALGGVAYLQLSGIVDFEDMLLENVGGEEERIEVEDGRFTFKAGDSEDDSQEMDGHVEINLDLSRDKPTLKEKRVYRQAGRELDIDWAEKLQEDAGDYEEELSRRVQNFVHDVKEQNSDGFICSICMDEFDTEDGLHMHQSLSHDIRCEVCGKKFETVRGLHIHQGMTHGEISHDLYQS